jgi:hypothetical protein
MMAEQQQQAAALILLSLSEPAPPTFVCINKTRLPFGKENMEILITWLYEHANCPYPSSDEFASFMQQTSLNLKQLRDWFANARRRRLRKRGAHE